jgi:hypothetical protein
MSGGRDAAPRLVGLSDRLYRALLLACPPAFRKAYGAEMAQVFRTSCREAGRASGAAGVLRLWAPALLDLVVTALAECVQGGANMSKSRMVRWSGLLALLGGALWPVTFVLIVGLEAVGAVTRSPTAPNLVQIVAYPAAWLFFAIGLVGLQARWAIRPRWLGWIAFAAALTGMLMLLVGGTGMGYVWYSNAAAGPMHRLCGSADCQRAQLVEYALYVCDFTGYLVLGAGMTLFGLLATVTRALPRGNRLLLVMGILAGTQYWLTDMGAPSILRNTGTPGVIVMASGTLLFTLVWSVGWIVLGRMLWTQPVEPEEVAGTQARPALS